MAESEIVSGDAVFVSAIYRGRPVCEHCTGMTEPEWVVHVCELGKRTKLDSLVTREPPNFISVNVQVRLVF